MPAATGPECFYQVVQRTVDRDTWLLYSLIVRENTKSYIETGEPGMPVKGLSWEDNQPRWWHRRLLSSSPPWTQQKYTYTWITSLWKKSSIAKQLLHIIKWENTHIKTASAWRPSFLLHTCSDWLPYFPESRQASRYLLCTLPPSCSKNKAKSPVSPWKECVHSFGIPPICAAPNYPRHPITWLC